MVIDSTDLDRLLREPIFYAAIFDDLVGIAGVIIGVTLGWKDIKKRNR